MSLPKLIPERKQEWIAALRSGEFTQGKGSLNLDNKYCCLGVACELAARAGIVSDRIIVRHPVTNSVFVRYDGEAEYLPRSVRIWLFGSDDIQLRNPIIETKSQSPSLASLNDSGVSFSKIANYIEEQL